MIFTPSYKRTSIAVESIGDTFVLEALNEFLTESMTFEVMTEAMDIKAHAEKAKQAAMTLWKKIQAWFKNLKNTVMKNLFKPRDVPKGQEDGTVTLSGYTYPLIGFNGSSAVSWWGTNALATMVSQIRKAKDDPSVIEDFLTKMDDMTIDNFKLPKGTPRSQFSGLIQKSFKGEKSDSIVLKKDEIVKKINDAARLYRHIMETEKDIEDIFKSYMGLFDNTNPESVKCRNMVGSYLSVILSITRGLEEAIRAAGIMYASHADRKDVDGKE